MVHSSSERNKRQPSRADLKFRLFIASAKTRSPGEANDDRGRPNWYCSWAKTLSFGEMSAKAHKHLFHIVREAQCQIYIRGLVVCQALQREIYQNMHAVTAVRIDD